jgi:DNA-binding XRE family transcriptional regulator
MLRRSKTSRFFQHGWVFRFPIRSVHTRAIRCFSSESHPTSTRNPIRWCPERDYDRLASGASRLAFLKMQFGRRVRQIRAEMGKTQEEFAEKAGMSVDFLSLIERGRNAPSFKKLELMIEGLEVSAAYLFTFEDSPPRKRTRKSGTKR